MGEMPIGRLQMGSFAISIAIVQADPDETIIRRFMEAEAHFRVEREGSTGILETHLQSTGFADMTSLSVYHLGLVPAQKRTIARPMSPAGVVVFVTLDNEKGRHRARRAVALPADLYETIFAITQDQLAEIEAGRFDPYVHQAEIERFRDRRFGSTPDPEPRLAFEDP
jgi:hypothetical protein